MKTYENIHAAYLGVLDDVYHNPEFTSSPRGQLVRETLDYQFRVMNPTSEPVVTFDVDRNKVIEAYTAKEVELYNSCSNSVDDFAKASKFWKQLANPDGTINSAYGYLIWKNKSLGNRRFEASQYSINEVKRDSGVLSNSDRTPWEWAKMSLIQDQHTRQAILRFSLPEHQWKGNKDQTCTMHGIFMIRDDKLNLSITMRSNDLMKGLVYDLPWFTSLIDRMLEELKDTYPSLEKGHYTHSVHSMHIYEKDKDAVLKMLGK